MIESASAAAIPPIPSVADRALDTLNPLQHIPFVGFLYRQITGDQITPDAQFAGGLLYGGPIGAIGAAASMILAGAFGDNADAKQAFSGTGETALPKIKGIDPWKFNA